MSWITNQDLLSPTLNRSYIKTTKKYMYCYYANIYMIVLLSSLIQHKFSKPITKETNRCLGIAAGAWRRSHSKINMSPNTLSRVLLNYQFANKKRQKRSKQIKKDTKFCSNLVHFRLTKGNFYILILCTNDRTWNRFIWYMSRALNFWNNGFDWVSLFLK